jgi:hypothetical protein
VLDPARHWRFAPDGEPQITVSQGGAVLLVLHPDTFISSTSITSALDCPSKAIVKERGYGGLLAGHSWGT